MGTYLTRRVDPFGAYPFQAAVIDGKGIVQAFTDYEGGHWDDAGMFAFGLLSLPLDFCLDLLLLPVDLGCWMAGTKKTELGPIR